MSDLSAESASPKPRRHRRKQDRTSALAATSAADAVIALPAELGIEQAAGLRAQLAPRLEENAPVVLDGADVQRIHTAAMQLFCLFCSDRRRAGRDTHWRRPSPALRSAAALLGITTLLQIARETA